MDELKRLENDTKKDGALLEKLNEAGRRLRDEGRYGSDGEIFVAAAKELGYDVTIAALEKARAEDEKLDMDALEAVSGGDSPAEDEKGHDGWCVTAWHCFAATLHTDAESPNVSCWKDFLCMFVNKDYDDWVKKYEEYQNNQK